MNMNFKCKLPIPAEVKSEYPVSEELNKVIEARNERIAKIIRSEDNRLMLIIGPCSADNEDSVIDYINRLREVQEKVNDKIFIVPRIYTNKPRTTGKGYKGMLHQPDPSQKPDMYKGIVAIRKMHLRAIQETGFTCADEMLYPENHRYLNDLLGYVAVGARSTENQQHRLTASGLNVPVGMKNPVSGSLNVLMNSIEAAQSGHAFLYRGWRSRQMVIPLLTQFSEAMRTTTARVCLTIIMRHFSFSIHSMRLRDSAILLSSSIQTTAIPESVLSSSTYR